MLRAVSLEVLKVLVPQGTVLYVTTQMHMGSAAVAVTLECQKVPQIPVATHYHWL